MKAAPDLKDETNYRGCLIKQFHVSYSVEIDKLECFSPSYNSTILIVQGRSLPEHFLMLLSNRRLLAWPANRIGQEMKCQRGKNALAYCPGDMFTTINFLHNL
jgi:hypothetical protein